MATYQHTFPFDNGGYIKFNVTPSNCIGNNSYRETPWKSNEPALGPGSTITISGVIKPMYETKRTVWMAITDPSIQTAPWTVRAYKNITFTKGKETAFSLSYRFTMLEWDAMVHKAREDGNDWVNGLLIQIYAHSVRCDKSDIGRSTGSWADQAATYIRYRVTQPDPLAISDAPVWTDKASVSALTVLGDIVTSHSRPRVVGTWAYDSSYPDQLGHAALTLTGAMSGTFEADTGSGVTEAAFDLPVPTQAGTVSWVYTVTDMFGNVATATGSFEVLSYVKPYITSCAFERYQEVQTDTGFEHEASASGEYIWLNLDANIAAVNSRNAWTATLTAWRKERPEIAPTAGSAVYENTTGERRTVSTWALAGSDGQHIQLARDEDNLSDEMVLSAAFDWCLRLTLTDALGNSVTLLVDDDIRKDSAILDVGPYGVSVGARSTALAADPQFECSYPATFYGNVAVPAGGLLKVVPLSVLASTSIAAGGYKYDTFTIAQSAIGEGWTPVGVAGYVINNRYISVYNLQVRADNPMQMTYGLYNGSTAARSTTLSVNVLCVRTGL